MDIDAARMAEENGKVCMRANSHIDGFSAIFTSSCIRLRQIS